MILATNYIAGSTSSYILAAEAEAVASNLDRLPPGLVRRPTKRKSEEVPLDQRKRGRHGGVIGRPRKSETRSPGTIHDVNKDAEKKGHLLAHEEAQVRDMEEEPQMVTRRTTRRSTTSNQNDSASEKPTDIQSPPNAPKKHSKSTGDKDVTMKDGNRIDVNFEDTTVGHEFHVPSPSSIIPTSLPSIKNASSSSGRLGQQSTISTEQSQPQRPETQTLSTGTRNADSPSANPKRKRKQRAMQTPTQAKAHKSKSTSKCLIQRKSIHPTNLYQAHAPGAERNDINTLAKSQNGATSGPAQISTHDPGHVEYFARIHTFVSTIDVPIAAEKIDDAEDKLIRKYAEWMAKEGGTDIPFKQFRSIFGFARED